MVKDSLGYTLIEMLVVMGIILMITFIALPNVSSYLQVSLNSAARDISTDVKEAYNAAMLSGKVYRIAYDLKENTFWVESGPAGVLLDTKESKDKAERRKKFFKEPKEGAAEDSSFMIDKTITRKKLPLPRGVVYEDIINQQGPDPITMGIAYTHFFPHGLAEQTIIHLKDLSQHQISLVITPLLGQMDLYSKYIKPDEINKKP